MRARPQNAPDWQEILTHFRGSELQNYFTRILEDDLHAIIKPQYVDHIPKAVRCGRPRRRGPAPRHAPGAAAPARLRLHPRAAQRESTEESNARTEAHEDRSFARQLACVH